MLHGGIAWLASAVKQIGPQQIAGEAHAADKAALSTAAALRTCLQFALLNKDVPKSHRIELDVALFIMVHYGANSCIVICCGP